MLAGLQLFPNQQQFLIVIFSHPGRVDTYPDMTETFILMEHGLDFPGIDKSGKVVVHIKGNTPYLRVAFQESDQGHRGSPTQGKPVAIPLPTLQLLKRSMGEGVNRSLKNRQVTAPWLIRRLAEAKTLITAADVLF